ncbi:thioredoxin family protein [Alteromonas sediminis]|uniref:Thioredoxin family protein n=1 Tax=Alteromonas sediminis TaxID=2259342 RepID=A0A3N5Y0L4_9ALTE|nr:thioredoxin family protein [Alteromonas sediminis]RPJ66413.1 thioredoxin family protein [Alteromonas sediminis]
MALTESTMLALGSPAPEFSLPNTEGKMIELSDFQHSRLLVVAFICNHCPYVVHIAPALSELSKRYASQDVAFVAINSNDVTAYPEDDLNNMQLERARRGYPFPYLFDETKNVAKAFYAACTPDFYVFDDTRKLVYRGQFDSTRPHRVSSGNYDSSQALSTGEDLRSALNALLANTPIPEPQVPSMGCNIKWKPGNAPDYF